MWYPSQSHWAPSLLRSEGSKSRFNPAIEYIIFLTQVVLVLDFFQGMLTGEKNEDVRNPSILCGCLFFFMYLFLNGFEALQFFYSHFDTESVYRLALITETLSL